MKNNQSVPTKHRIPDTNLTNDRSPRRVKSADCSTVSVMMTHERTAAEQFLYDLAQYHYSVTMDVADVIDYSWMPNDLLVEHTYHSDVEDYEGLATVLAMRLEASV